jgi:dihydrofolate reductase
MAKLIYSAITSLDGYVEDAEGNFDWGRPDDELFAFYSRTLESTSSAKTRIERELDPEAVRQMKEAVGSDITIGGAELAGEAIRAGLVDECHLFLVPVLVGAGKCSLPAGVRAQLHLLDERRFGSGVVHLRYRM